MRPALRPSPPPVVRLFFGITAHTAIQLGILLPETASLSGMTHKWQLFNLNPVNVETPRSSSTRKLFFRKGGTSRRGFSSVPNNFFVPGFSPDDEILPGATMTGQSGVNPHIEPRGVEALITRQIQRGIGNILGGPRTFQIIIKVFREPTGPEFVFLSGLCLVASPEDGGHDRSRRDAVNTNPVLSKFNSQNFGDVDHPGFAYRIEGAPSHPWSHRRCCHC